jgi:preprotein translocase subunit SecG
MGVIGIVLLVILIISAILLVLVVLVQDDQGEGIGGIFGGGSNTAFGSRSGNVLTRFTSVLAAIFLVCCFAVAWVNKSPVAGNVLSKAREQALSNTAQQSWYQQTTSGGTTVPSGASTTTPSGAAGAETPSGSGSTTSSPGGQ